MSYRLRIKIQGKVQGIGFRPTVYRYATQNKLTGWVSNTSSGVIIEVQGTKVHVENFISALKKSPPSRSEIADIQVTEIKPVKENQFKVLSSISGKEMKTRISPDIAVCKDCLKELFDKEDRRYLYPFINCTNCGPRFTIIKNIPYDRPNTTMKKFKMCKSCQSEYDNPSDRRFHAQPNACEICGPEVKLVNSLGFRVESKGIKAIEKTTKLLKEGKIVAIKGLGGFHLACDALNDKAVKTLRSRKYREDKPFALMAKDLKTIKKYCEVSPEEEKFLLSWKSPIVLLKRKSNTPYPVSLIPISNYVAPNNKYLGFMLPYAPLHHLLFKSEIRNPKSEILVMTSGNISDEPIAYENEEALVRLKNIADYFLLHDRDIYIRSDDSVTRIFPPTKKEFILRRSKGYTPDPISIHTPYPLSRIPILACGAHSKNTFAILKGDEVILSHHIGDMENAETYNSFVNGIEHFKKLLEVEPQIIAHDLHPEYFSTQYAKNLSSVNCHLSSVPIQHHHAHIASVMADNMLRNQKVIGIAFDGTGLGSDGNLWGGEFLLADYKDFKRVGHFKYIPLPGGEKAIKEPWRIAFSELYSIFGNKLWKLDINFVKKLDKGKCKILQKMLDSGVNAPLTSSMGRLFDAVASLIGIRNTVNYEGQAAIELEMILTEDRKQKSEVRNYKYTIKKENNIYIIDMEETIKGIIEDLKKRLSKEIISLKFHNTIVGLIVDMAKKIRKETGLKEVALGGGVFQNMFLLTNAYKELKKAGLKVYIHEKVPTNDGGLSLGQAVIAGCKN
ncbi:MAG: carbamoyltransferase HypF [Candidatus Ratteibacteria bacterium]|nr:carbamoyltransferase HypF [Candidatus Ratteibacteria bacterium]